MLKEILPITKNEIKRIANIQRFPKSTNTNSFIIDGEKGVQEALASRWQIRQVVIDKEKISKYKSILSDNYDCFSAFSTDMQKMSNVVTSPGILAEVVIPDIQEINPKESVILCATISDPGNLGSIIRSADWFGIKNIIISSDSVYPFTAKVVRSSMGSIFRMNIKVIQDVSAQIQALKAQKYTVIATTLNGSTPSRAKSPFCLIMGNESKGLPKEIIDLSTTTFTIPKLGGAESLNVGVACGIVLYELTTK